MAPRKYQGGLEQGENIGRIGDVSGNENTLSGPRTIAEFVGEFLMIPGGPLGIPAIRLFASS